MSSDSNWNVKSCIAITCDTSYFSFVKIHSVSLFKSFSYNRFIGISHCFYFSKSAPTISIMKLLLELLLSNHIARAVSEMPQLFKSLHISSCQIDKYIFVTNLPIASSRQTR